MLEGVKVWKCEWDWNRGIAPKHLLTLVLKSGQKESFKNKKYFLSSQVIKSGQQMRKKQQSLRNLTDREIRFENFLGGPFRYLLLSDETINPPPPNVMPLATIFWLFSIISLLRCSELRCIWQYSGSFGLDFGLKLAFVVTWFPQKVWLKRITNWYHLVYMTARVQCNKLEDQSRRPLVRTIAMVQTIPKRNQYIVIQDGGHFGWIWNSLAVRI